MLDVITVKVGIEDAEVDTVTLTVNESEDETVGEDKAENDPVGDVDIEANADTDDEIDGLAVAVKDPETVTVGEKVGNDEVVPVWQADGVVVVFRVGERDGDTDVDGERVPVADPDTVVVKLVVPLPVIVCVPLGDAV